MTEHIANSRQSLEDVVGLVRAAWERSKFIRVVIREKVRSLNQNDQAHVWYGIVSRTLGEDTELGVKCESKLNVGVPILCAVDSEFRHFWDAVSRGLTYEEQLEAIRFVKVTSRMDVHAATEYLTRLQRYWEDRRVTLEFQNKRAA